jgi:hypothetical protein
MKPIALIALVVVASLAGCDRQMPAIEAQSQGGISPVDRNQLDFNNAASIRGLAGVSMLVAPPMPEVLRQVAADTATALGHETLTAVAQLKLNRAGITTFLPASKEVIDGTAPLLYLRVDAKPAGSVYAYSVVLELLQRVSLARDRGTFVTAVTWASRQGLGEFGLVETSTLAKSLRGIIDAQLDEFITVFRTENRAK